MMEILGLGPPTYLYLDMMTELRVCGRHVTKQIVEGEKRAWME
jgi:hypothetical protein